MILLFLFNLRNKNGSKEQIAYLVLENGPEAPEALGIFSTLEHFKKWIIKNKEKLEYEYEYKDENIDKMSVNEIINLLNDDIKVIEIPFNPSIFCDGIRVTFW